ncbi:hypothetical protein [Corynebacterium sp. Marseille-P4321]|uniref:hypothetical protein n=1 Tax=Corynebacterium sp. Marseille-P4321 TaxID=2736603 RepID=UPI00158C3A70|nr:hypothetical protein [Corynebacterium sp. Marseille-P4321]
MDRNEKKKLREKISEFLDLEHTRLSDDDASLLSDFVDNYDDYRGSSHTRTSSYDGFSSDGKFTRKETTTETFLDSPGVRVDYSFTDDDGMTGESSHEIRDGRGMIDFLRKKRW